MPERNPAPNETAEGDALDWARPLVERQLAMLGDLAELGLEVARAVERQAKAAGPEVDLNRLSMAYARAARAVRMTIALQSKVIHERQAFQEAAAQKRAEAEAQQDHARFDLQQERKVRVARILRRVIASAEEDAIDRLVTEAAERLEDDDLCGDLLSRPLGEIVADICRDLGLSPDWPRLAEEAWAKAEMAAGPRGSPFADRIPRPLEGGEVRSGGDGSAAVRPTGHPHPPPFPHQGGRRSPHAASP